jgi:chromosome segregation ATPase
MKAYQRHPMPVRTAEGNGEERAAQIQHIQERLTRLHRVHEQISGEVNQLTADVKTLTEEPAPPAPPEKEPN